MGNVSIPRQNLCNCAAQTLFITAQNGKLALVVELVGSLKS